MSLTVGSLFAGIGGFDLGLERAGMTVKWQCEIDPFARAVLAKHWPQVRRYEDVREIHAPAVCPSGGVCLRCVEPVDVLCGGFPCQDISSSGPRTGIAGAKSGLWAQYLRLIRELRPRYVIVENVADIVHRGLGVVVGELAAIRYDAEWSCIQTSRFGLPQTRDRMWIIAYPGGCRRGPGDERKPAGPLYFQWPHDDRLVEAQAVAQACADRSWRVDDGLPEWVDRMRALGNSLSPQIAEWLGRQILNAERAA